MLSSLLAVILISASWMLPDEIIADVALQLLTRAGPHQEFECAAFIVAGAGSFTLRHWPRDRAFRGAQWLGAIPAGAVAIIHTHPHTNPLPSPQDAREARRTQLPFYVVSRGSLAVVEPSGIVRAARTIPWLHPSSVTTDLRWRVNP